MNRSVNLNEASAAHRSFHFRPPDPLWISTAAVEEARAELQAFEPRLSLWWSNTRHGDDAVTPGRWRVVEWLKSQGNWTTTFYLEGPGGSYRDPLPMGWILQRLWRAARNTEEIAREVDEENAKVDSARRIEIVQNVSGYENDLRARRMGGKIISAPGHIRRRTVKRSDILRSNHANYLRSLGLDPAIYMR